MSKKFDEKFKNVLKAENTTVAKFAKITDVHYTRLSEYHRGIINPSYVNLIKILEVIPEYTAYLLDIDPVLFKNQKTPKTS
jgi:transcriptional regulator with XRE-family HTH domain